MNSFKLFLTLLLLPISVLLHVTPCQAQLSTTFYDATCPNASTIIRNSIRRAISAERRMAASLIRLHFHDCFVQGCDASILLDETATIQSEKTAVPNANSVRGFNVIEAAKRACPGIVSCADVLTLAARDASVAIGGPTWNVRLGRRDSTTANRDAANTDLPSLFAGLDVLIDAFDKKGLSARDMVALSGAHTLGQSQCLLFRGRIYSNGTDIDALPAPEGGAAPRRERKGLLQSDQVLFSGSTANIVSQYSGNPRTFAADFAAAMIKMSEIPPLLVGDNGIIRGTCSTVN
ncbi:peroxidase [Salvia divinorum]|uniref:Peroxidase n=1 Tax=Salvia divinorum TaxID=28513 RepID=A0ABD1HKN1_SALDI